MTSKVRRTRRPARGGDAADDDAATGFAAVLGGAALVALLPLGHLHGGHEGGPPRHQSAIRGHNKTSSRRSRAHRVGREQWSSVAQGASAWLTISLFAAVDGTAFQGCLSEGLQRTSAGLGA